MLVQICPLENSLKSISNRTNENVAGILQQLCFSKTSFAVINPGVVIKAVCAYIFSISNEEYLRL